MYQRREQVALMALLNGKADAEAEAWAKLQKITQTSPWAGERSPEDIEHSWRKWESKGKQVRLRGGPGHRGGRHGLPRGFTLNPWRPQMSEVVGAAYKPKDRSRSHQLLSTHVQYGWMKHQVRQGGACFPRCWCGRLGGPSHPQPPSCPRALQSGAGERQSLNRTLGHRQFWEEAGLAGALDTRPWTQVLSLRTPSWGRWEAVLHGPGTSDLLQRISQSLWLFVWLFVRLHTVGGSRTDTGSPGASGMEGMQGRSAWGKKEGAGDFAGQLSAPSCLLLGQTQASSKGVCHRASSLCGGHLK